MKLLAILMFLLFVGCAATTKLKASDCKVYQSPPSMEYIEVGTFAYSDEDYGNVIETLQKRVINAGGNAMIIQNDDKSSEHSLAGGQDQNINMMVIGIKTK